MGMSSANNVDYTVIGLYALLMVVVGLYVMRFNRGAAEYFRGGSRIPWLVAGLSCFMSGFSAWTFTGAAGVAYRSGIAATGMYIGNALSFLLGYYGFRSPLAAKPDHHRNGIPIRTLQPHNTSGFLLDYDSLPTVYQRQYFVRA